MKRVCTLLASMALPLVVSANPVTVQDGVAFAGYWASSDHIHIDIDARSRTGDWAAATHVVGIALVDFSPAYSGRTIIANMHQLGGSNIVRKWSTNDSSMGSGGLPCSGVSSQASVQVCAFGVPVSLDSPLSFHLQAAWGQEVDEPYVSAKVSVFFTDLSQSCDQFGCGYNRIGDTFDQVIQVVAVPEPAQVVLFAVGMIGLMVPRLSKTRHAG